MRRSKVHCGVRPFCPGARHWLARRSIQTRKSSAQACAPKDNDTAPAKPESHTSGSGLGPI
eukprot:scaffold269_cov404-Prasinococcus_capsulatus_cf.AAC.14